MIVNNGANLSKDYFISYLKLVREARSFSLEQAQNYMDNYFFKNNNDVYGKESYYNFFAGYRNVKVERVISCCKDNQASLLVCRNQQHRSN